MGLYDVVLGDGHQGERGAVLLALLGNPGVGRFRDAWAEKGDDGEPVIAVYTRIGGPNREDYAAVIDALTAHPLYICDADDSFDATYATFWFRVPALARDALAKVAVEPVDMSARWQEAIARVQRGDLRPAETAMMDQLAAALTDPSPGDGPNIIRI